MISHPTSALLKHLAGPFALAAVLACCPIGALGADDPGSPPPRKGPPNGQGQRPARPGLRDAAPPGEMLRDLTRVFNEEQRAQFREALQSRQAEWRKLEEKASRLRAELNEATFAATFDAGAVRQKARELAEVESERLVLRSEALARIRPSLTDEQLSQIQNLMAEARRPRRMGPRPGGPDELRDRRPLRPGEAEREGADLPPPRPKTDPP